MSIDYSTLPVSLQDGVRRYIEQGILPGDFLQAVISNNLKMAVLRADDVNRARLAWIVAWFTNEAPITCWGSATDMNCWVEAAAYRRRNQSVTP